jgi:hypothetical protein
MAVDHAKIRGRPHKKAVEGPEGINPVKGVHKSEVVIVSSPGVVEDTHAAQSVKPTAAVMYPNAAYSAYPPVEVVVYRYVLNLDDCAEIVKLYEGIVVEPGIEGDGGRAYPDPGIHLQTGIDVEIKFPIRIEGEGNPVFHKNKGVGKNRG